MTILRGLLNTKDIGLLSIRDVLDHLQSKAVARAATAAENEAREAAAAHAVWIVGRRRMSAHACILVRMLSKLVFRMHLG